MEAQRYPEDYDGIIAGAPAAYWTHNFASFIWTLTTFGPAGAYIPSAKLNAIQAAPVRARAFRPDRRSQSATFRAAASAGGHDGLRPASPPARLAVWSEAPRFPDLSSDLKIAPVPERPLDFIRECLFRREIRWTYHVTMRLKQEVVGK